MSALGVLRSCGYRADKHVHNMTFSVEQATVATAAECAAILRTTRQHCLPYLPDLHTPDEDVAFLRDHVFASNTVFIAFDVTRKLLGLIAFAGGWVNHLYVLPEFQVSGIGTRLLEQAKQQSSILKLWTFERNRDARRFYERHGFSVIDRTDCSLNEENEPDLLLQWNRQR